MPALPQKLIIRRPDDWHVHLRDGAMMRAVLPYTASIFARAIIMPNLKPAITNRGMASAYEQRILEALPPNSHFTPLMTLYLTDQVDMKDLEEGFKEGLYAAAKYYPAGATTNSASGVTDLKKIYLALETMERIGMPLLLHGEVNTPGIDVFDREKIFIEQELGPLIRYFPDLKIVLEHITTKDAARFVREKSAKNRIGATITPHHLIINRNAMFENGRIRPHFYCLPVAKREEHRKALVDAATSAAPCFFLGTDSAPHPARAKEGACGCAGIFCAPHALEDYVQVFEDAHALDLFEAFASVNGARFYGLPENEGKITLVREAPNEMESIEAPDNDRLIPFVPSTKRRWGVETIQS